MSLNIKNPATVALVDELARRLGISKTAAIHQALTERLHRMGYGDVAQERLLTEMQIRGRVSRLPELDSRSDEEMARMSMEFRTDGNRYLCNCRDPAQ